VHHDADQLALGRVSLRELDGDHGFALTRRKCEGDPRFLSIEQCGRDVALPRIPSEPLLLIHPFFEHLAEAGKFFLEIYCNLLVNFLCGGVHVDFRVNSAVSELIYLLEGHVTTLLEEVHHLVEIERF